MANHFLVFLLAATMNIAFAQKTPPDEYFVLIKRADSLYKSKEYRNSGHTYSSAFKTFGWKGYSHHRYNAACSWALANVSDSAFANLDRIALKANYAEYDHILNDQDLVSLHNDSRWQPLLKVILKNKEVIEVGYNKPLIKLLDSLVQEDQKWRNYFTKYNNRQLGEDTTSYQDIIQTLRLTDSLNYFHLKRIFIKYGFPNFDLAGQKGSSNFWLLMQHQDAHPEFQQEVLSKMKIEVDKGKASPVNYAYLLDRVKVNTGQLQAYGTQMKLNDTSSSFEPHPVIEPDKLNERRKSVGLESIESYIELMNSNYFGNLKREKVPNNIFSK